MTLSTTTPPPLLFIGGPLVATPIPRIPATHTVVELDRSRMTLVSRAATLLIERHDGSPRKAAAAHGMAAKTLEDLRRMATPWAINAAVIARIERALRLRPGGILRGECPAPKTTHRREVQRVTRGGVKAI